MCVCFQVLCIGPTGTGKTLTMSNKLLNSMPAEYITHFLMFSARTSANQTQDFIDSKVDKRYRDVFQIKPTRYFQQGNNIAEPRPLIGACACVSGGKVCLDLQ